MSLLVIGGHTRNIGKTSVVAGLVAALADFQWMAVKITQFGHGVCSVNGESCDCAVDEHTFAITEDRNRTSGTDTGRFLLAGAKQALWVRTKQGNLAEAMPELRARILQANDVIIESNSVIKFLRPDLYISVLDEDVEDFKASAREFLDRADAYLIHRAEKGRRWSGISSRLLQLKPNFAFTPPDYVPADLVAFVRERLQTIERSGRS